jgi:hypothetical protein
MSFDRKDRVRVAVLDLDGWEQKARISAAKDRPELLAAAGMPADEAERIARETLGQREAS